MKPITVLITAKYTSRTPEEAKELAIRALMFKKYRNRLPSMTSQNPWEQRMVEVAAFVRFKNEGRYECVDGLADRRNPTSATASRINLIKET